MPTISNQLRLYHRIIAGKDPIKGFREEGFTTELTQVTISSCSVSSFMSAKEPCCAIVGKLPDGKKITVCVLTKQNIFQAIELDATNLESIHAEWHNVKGTLKAEIRGVKVEMDSYMDSEEEGKLEEKLIQLAKTKAANKPTTQTKENIEEIQPKKTVSDSDSFSSDSSTSDTSSSDTSSSSDLSSSSSSSKSSESSSSDKASNKKPTTSPKSDSSSSDSSSSDSSSSDSDSDSSSSSSDSDSESDKDSNKNKKVKKDNKKQEKKPDNKGGKDQGSQAKGKFDHKKSKEDRFNKNNRNDNRRDRNDRGGNRRDGFKSFNKERGPRNFGKGGDSSKGDFNCFNCQFKARSRDELFRHKDEKHPRTPRK